MKRHKYMIKDKMIYRIFKFKFKFNPIQRHDTAGASQDLGSCRRRAYQLARFAKSSTRSSHALRSFASTCHVTPFRLM